MISIFTEGIKKKELKGKRIIYKNIKDLIAREGNKIPGDINIILCNDAYLLEINKKYLNHDTLTDIITFDYCEEKIVSGDIYISIDRVEENAKLFNQDNERELTRVIFHGVLHLLGYKDKSDTEQKEMRGKEDFYLNLFL